MTTVTASNLPTTQLRLPTWRLVLGRIGIVLTTIMACFNTINGGAMLLGVQTEVEASPVIGGLLFGIGLPTLLLTVPAWRSMGKALAALIVLRFLEAGTMWVPMGPGDWYSAPENRPFYLVLVAVSLTVSGLMFLGLRRRTP